MTKIEEVLNERTGQIEVFLNGKRLEDLGDDHTAILLEILKNMLDCETDEQRNAILARISHHLGDGNNSLQDIRSVLVDICDKIGEGGGGSSEEIERVKRELLLLIHLLDQKIDEQKLVAGRGIIIEDNVISTTGGSYIDKLIEDYEKLLQDYNRLLERADQLEGEVSVLRERNTTLTQDKERLERELHETTLKYERSLTEIARLEAEIKRLEEIIASGEDYKLYKKYEQLYHQAEAEARKWKKEYEQLLRCKKNQSRMKTIVHHVDCLTGQPVYTTFN